MRTRAVVAALAAVSVIAVPAAQATTRHRSCKLLTDPRGDVDWTLVHGTPIKPATVDIISGDMSSGRKTIVMVLQLASTKLSGDPYAYLEYSYNIGASTTNGHTISFQARYLPTGGRSGGWMFSNRVDSTAVTAQFKVIGNTLKFTLPRAASPILSLPNLTFRQFHAETDMFGTAADIALNTRSTYKDRYPSCVPAS